MKRIIIICEGETEKEFVEKILQQYFLSKDMELIAPLIKKSKGGIVPWKYLKKQVENHLKCDKSAIVTTLLDYYGICEKHEFPNWENSHLRKDKNQILDELENAMKEDIDEKIRDRFIPYLQLHEFEGLLFSDKDELLSQIPSEDINIQELDKVFSAYSNPEDINNGKQTSPSHRLSKIIKGYNKVIYGNIIVEGIGINKIRSKALRFNRWLEILEK